MLRQTDRIRKLKQQRQVTQGLLQSVVQETLAELWADLQPTLQQYDAQRPQLAPLEKHLPGQHDQQDHAGDRTAQGSLVEAGDDWFDYDHATAIAAASAGEDLSTLDFAGEKLTPEEQTRYKHQAELLQAAASTRRTTHKRVFRGVTIEGNDYTVSTKYPVSGVITLDRLTASTPDLNIAVNYSDPAKFGQEDTHIGVIFEIEDPNGVFGYQRTPGVEDPYGAEVVLPRGARYRVTRRRTMDNGDIRVTLYALGGKKVGRVKAKKILGEQQDLRKHLPGKHDQQEHGNRNGGGRETETPKLIRNSGTDLLENTSARNHKVVSQMVKRQRVGHIVRGVETVNKFEMERRQGRHTKEGTEIAGYYDLDTHSIVLSSTLTANAARVTALHEVGHAVDIAYPSMRYEFLSYLDREAPAERRKMESKLKSLKYSPLEINMESFAEFQAVVYTKAGRKHFPKAAAWIRGKFQEIPDAG